MSTQLAMAIGIVLYLLSCWRAWRRITKTERATLRSPHPSYNLPHPPIHTGPAAVHASSAHVAHVAMSGGERNTVRS
jgi:hypothetical protein